MMEPAGQEPVVTRQEPAQEPAQEQQAPSQKAGGARITSPTPSTKPEKNPGRVAAGKRLAESNRKNREAKKRASLAAAGTATKAPPQQPLPTTEPAEEPSNTSGFYVLSIAGLIVSLVSLYYKRREVLAAIAQKPPGSNDIQEVVASSGPPKSSALLSMD